MRNIDLAGIAVLVESVGHKIKEEQ